MNIGGKFVEAACVMLCLALCAVSLGTLVSIFSNNEFQIVQFIPIAVIPQIFFSGLIPLDTIPMGLGKIAYAMPVYYACTALKKLIIYHQGFGDISSYLFVLLGITLVLSAINTLALRRYRKI
ncbi:MAG: hypothetical protein BGN88_02585 [Clostridiales bacterium 43-6]|nr:MAG: hypothetical protein BGN88_02585 [Clostridiales bacterium 43-6]